MSMEEVLAQVSDSRTDLARLIQAAAREEWPCVVVSSQAVQAWERRAPDAWTTAQEWLLSLDKPLVIV
jgi:hypothetical protein